MMTLNEGIKHCLNVARSNERYCRLYPEQLGYRDDFYNAEKRAIEHRQLAEWLKELKKRREQPEIIRCKDCRWGKEVCGNIECFVDSNIPSEYHGYEWFCPNGERRTDE